MNEVECAVRERFNQERRDTIRDGLRLIAAEIVVPLIVWWRVCPLAWSCRKVVSCRGGILPDFMPPFYVILSCIALPVIMWFFTSFEISFSLNQAIGPDNKFIRPRWLIGALTFSSLTAIIFLFAALQRWTGISGDAANPIHELGYCIYFSVITITTVGYGDYHPAAHSAFSHAVAAVEAMSGYLILGVLVSSFSSMFRRPEA